MTGLPGQYGRVGSTSGAEGAAREAAAALLRIGDDAFHEQTLLAYEQTGPSGCRWPVACLKLSNTSSCSATNGPRSVAYSG